MSAELVPPRVVFRASPPKRLRLTAAERDAMERSRELRIALYTARVARVVATRAWRRREETIFG